MRVPVGSKGAKLVQIVLELDETLAGGDTGRPSGRGELFELS